MIGIALTRAEVVNSSLIAVVGGGIFTVWFILTRFGPVPLRTGAYATIVTSFVAMLATGLYLGVPGCVVIVGSLVIAGSYGGAMLLADSWLSSLDDSKHNRRN
jgi:hypothetical protein